MSKKKCPKCRGIFQTGKNSKYELHSSVFVEYTRNSTIHGFRYLGDNQSARCALSKIFWIVAFIISCLTCFIPILTLWQKWDSNPVVITFDEVKTDVSAISFPAVTICPSSKVSKSEVDIVKNFLNLQAGINLTDSQLQKMKALYHICDDDNGLADYFDHFLLRYETDNDGHNVAAILKNFSVAEHQITESELKFGGTIRKRDVFTRTLTEDGVCLTFNMLDFDDMFHNRTVHDKYTSAKIKFGDEHYPIYVIGASKSYSLIASMSSSSNNREFICNGLEQGYKIILHAPNEFPLTKTKYFLIPFNYKAEVMVKPYIMTMSRTIENVPLNKRQCYLNGERNLYYFKFYTKNNCELECLTNYTINVCGCARFFMPRETGTQICGTSKIKCYNNVSRTIIQNLESDECNCLPPCNSISYDAEMNEFVYDIENYLSLYGGFLANISNDIVDDPLPEAEGMQYNRISIYFKHGEFVRTKRTVLYGWSDFIANCGGLLGLFMGISILSFVEIFYFCVYRILQILKPSSIYRIKAEDVAMY